MIEMAETDNSEIGTHRKGSFRKIGGSLLLASLIGSGFLGIRFGFVNSQKYLYP